MQACAGWRMANSNQLLEEDGRGYSRDYELLLLYSSSGAIARWHRRSGRNADSSMPERHKNVGSHSGQRVKVTGMGAKQVNSKPKEHAHKDACGRGKTSRPESVHPCLGGHSGRACVSWATLTGNDVRDSDKLAKPAVAMMTSEKPSSYFNSDVRDL